MPGALLLLEVVGDSQDTVGIVQRHIPLGSCLVGNLTHHLGDYDVEIPCGAVDSGGDGVIAMRQYAAVVEGNAEVQPLHHGVGSVASMGCGVGIAALKQHAVVIA